MDEYRSLDERDVIRWAEAALTQSYGAPVGLSDVERLSRDDRRNLVLRARATTDRETRFVIIKATRSVAYDANASDAFSEFGFVKEWVAREVLERSREHVHSSRLAGDAANGLIVFSDFGAQLPSLVKSLLEGSAQAAEADLAAYAIAMARLHISTIGCRKRHGEALASAFLNAARPGLMGADWLNRAIPQVAGMALPEDELDRLWRRLANPGPWVSLVHADGCPDNILLDEGQARLIDFEFSAPGHMLLDAVYWRLGFPSCWCAGVVPDDVADRIEALYRRELATVLQLAADDVAFAHEIAMITLGRTLFSLSWMLQEALVVDKVWGTSTRRSRILWYLQAAIRVCDRNGLFPKSSVVLAAWLNHLRREWPDSDPLAVYPAFRPVV